MFGRIFQCTACDFAFASGWSHHSGGQHLVCPECGELFTLKGRSEWGTRIGETLSLSKNGPGGAIPSGSEAEVLGIRMGNNDRDAGVMRLDLTPILCPCCSRGDLVQNLADRQSCPQCHSGAIKEGGSCIY